MNKYKYLSFDARKIIEKKYLNGDRPADIAEAVGVHAATIYHELKRGYTGEEDKNFRPGYSAEIAQRVIQERFKARGKRKKAEAAAE